MFPKLYVCALKNKIFMMPVKIKIAIGKADSMWISRVRGMDMKILGTKNLKLVSKSKLSFVKLLDLQSRC